MSRSLAAGRAVAESRESRSTAPVRARYEPIAQIGRGGMAEVLLTMAHAGGGAFRLEVLKRIWPELAADPDFVTMFLDEARLSLRLNHPNVVQTHEVLVGDGELAIAMEYLDGQPLTRILNRLLRGPGALSLPLRLRILSCVLAGLEHAHTLTDLDGKPMGVVHRDVSPPNVFVTYDGQVKLVDFGVAKTLAASHHTRPGAIKGKLAYMAPEQLQSSAIDRRADIFAVGVMLWEMLAERRMWHRMTEVEIVGHLAAGKPMPPLPVAGDDSMPAGLDAICARALATDPDRRYQTAQEMEIELELALAGAADSHARNLGKLVSMAFATERAERSALIERSVARCGKSGRPAAPARPGRPDAITAIEIPVDDLQLQRPVRARDSEIDDERHDEIDDEIDPTPALLVPPRLTAGRPDWWRRAAAVCGLIAAVTTSLLAVGWRRTPAPEAGAAQGAVATAAPPAAAGGPPAANGLTFEVLPVPAQPQPARPAAVARTDEREHRRRHHRRHAAADNTALPPSNVDTGGVDFRP
ncbi:MAG TPA: serine/threonine-protein kinase [Polyangia bacterium]|jgi:serine/threonine-protein kinase